MVYSVLNPGLLVPVYKDTKRDDETPDEYVVIMARSITGGLMQVCHIDVNYHVKDLAPGIPNIEKREAGETAVISLLHGVDDYQADINIHIELDEKFAQQTVRNEALNEHYSNIRFIVRIINK